MGDGDDDLTPNEEAELRRGTADDWAVTRDAYRGPAFAVFDAEDAFRKQVTAL